MKNIFLIMISCCLLFATACDDKMDVSQQGVVSLDGFYTTDEDAEEAIAAVYIQWRGLVNTEKPYLNGLSDDMYAGGGARGDNPFLENICEYNFSTANSWINDHFRLLYTMILQE